MKRTISGKLLVAVIMMLCGWKLADAAGPVLAQQVVDGSRGDDQAMMGNDIFARVIEIAEGAGTVDELQELLQNDPLVQETGLIPGSDIMVSSINAGDCHLSPLLCLFKSYTPDLRCVYDCIGLRGSGEIIRRQLEECDFLVGCLLFENCLTLCIAIIPHDFPSIIW